MIFSFELRFHLLLPNIVSVLLFDHIGKVKIDINLLAVLTLHSFFAVEEFFLTVTDENLVQRLEYLLGLSERVKIVLQRITLAL